MCNEMLRRQKHGTYLSSRLSSSTKRVAAHCICYSTECNKQIYAADGPILSICQNTFSACYAWCRQHCEFTAALHQSNPVNMLMPVTQSHCYGWLSSLGTRSQELYSFFLPLAAFPFFLSHKFDKDFTNFPTLQQKETSFVSIFPHASEAGPLHPSLRMGQSART